MKAIKMLALSILFVAGTTTNAMTEVHPDGKRLLQDGGWEKLGTKMVNMQGEHDEIIVTALDGVFTKVKLKIMKAPIHLLNINIIFANGTNKNVVFNKQFAAGSETRIIDLPGNRRIIKKVNLNYKSIPTGTGRAVVTLFGMH